MPLRDGVQRHLVQGGIARHEHDTSHEELLRQYDADGDVNYGDPMADFTAGVGNGNFEGPGLTAILNASAAESAGLDSGAGSRGDMVNMASANDNSGGADGGPTPDAYGPRFTGRS